MIELTKRFSSKKDFKIYITCKTQKEYYFTVLCSSLYQGHFRKKRYKNFNRYIKKYHPIVYKYLKTLKGGLIFFEQFKGS